MASRNCKLLCLSWRKHWEYGRNENFVKNGEHLICKEKIIRSVSYSSLPCPCSYGILPYLVHICHSLCPCIYGFRNGGTGGKHTSSRSGRQQLSRFYDVSLLPPCKRGKYRHIPFVRCPPSERKSEPCMDICPPCSTWSYRADDFVCNSPEDMILYTVSICLFARIRVLSI